MTRGICKNLQGLVAQFNWTQPAPAPLQVSGATLFKSNVSTMVIERKGIDCPRISVSLSLAALQPCIESRQSAE
jgi:hypothetical protein